jgi:hypothetical protein
MKWVQYLPVLPFATFVMMGILATFEYYFYISSPYNAEYSILFGVFVYMLSLLSVKTIDKDSMFGKKVFAFLVGLAIVGLLRYANLTYERSNVWGSLLSSLLYIQILVIGFDFSLNPLFFE